MQILKNKAGYTLIEMILVIMLLSVLMPTIFSIIYILLQQQLKIYRLIETKRQGDRIMSLMKEKITRETQLIRNASNTPQCTIPATSFSANSSASDFYFMKGTAGASPSFRFVLNGTDLYEVDPALGLNASLNDSNVTISNLQVQCYRRGNVVSPFQNNLGGTLIGFSFTVTYNDSTPTTQEGTTSLPYQIKVKLRY